MRRRFIFQPFMHLRGQILDQQSRHPAPPLKLYAIFCLVWQGKYSYGYAITMLIIEKNVKPEWRQDK
jgi:hypothetical protein